MSTMHTQERLTAALEALAASWSAVDRPAGTSGPRRPPGPSTPLTAGWLVREAAGRCVAFWLHAAYDDGLALPAHGESVAVHDTPAAVAQLRRHVVELSGWAYVEEMTAELAGHAGELAAITADPPEGIRIGRCPLDGHDGNLCNAPLVAMSLTAPITCPGCGRAGTVTQWAPVLTQRSLWLTRRDLVDVLAWGGIRTTAEAIHMRSQRGSLPRPKHYTPDGEALYNAIAVLSVYLAA